MLSHVKIISFEIGNDCNLKKIHDKCPINHRNYLHTKFGHLTCNNIIDMIDEAKGMGFCGYYAFHFYNEPMMYQNQMKEIIQARKDEKFLLWTNGTYFQEGGNEIIKLFHKVVITCYFPEKKDFYDNLAQKYKNIVVQEWELDNRLNIYEKN